MLQRCLDIIDGGLVFMWTYLCKSHLFCSFCKYAFSKQHKLLPSLQVYFDCSCSLADQNIMCSASVFGVSTESMQCSYDSRGNSVPTILLMMQRRLYEQGGLRVRFKGLLCFLIYILWCLEALFWSNYCCLVLYFQAEGIFRINAENSQEEFVRDQLNSGIVPDGIDVHCLAGLIKVIFFLSWSLCL